MIVDIRELARTSFDDCLAGEVELLSPATALRRMLADVVPIEGGERLSCASAYGRVCAADIRSEVELPRFNNSAVDGYGLHADDLRSSGPFTLDLLSSVRAGQATTLSPMPGQTVRILTGAPVPIGVAAIVMEEHTRPVGSRVTFDGSPRIGANIRLAGEDVGTGTIVILAGEVIDARHAAMMAACGIAHIDVRRRLLVAVLSTGDELADGPAALAPNAIVDSNRPMLMSLLSGSAIDVTDLGIVGDDRTHLTSMLAGAADHFDLLISTGGVSGSEADHLHPAVVAAGGQCTTMKLALRPGKPIATGRLGRMKVVSLPGNPVAALVGHTLFVRPLLAKVLGTRSPPTDAITAMTAEMFPHRHGRTEFVPVAVVGRSDDGLPLLTKLGRGGSARLLPIVQADGFAELSADTGDIGLGGIVAFHSFSKMRGF